MSLTRGGLVTLNGQDPRENVAALVITKFGIKELDHVGTHHEVGTFNKMDSAPCPYTNGYSRVTDEQNCGVMS